MFSHRTEAIIDRKGALHLDALPFDSGDKVEIIILKQEPTTTSHQKQRTVGEYAGRIRMADDFTAPLPDGFWIGESR